MNLTIIVNVKNYKRGIVSWEELLIWANNPKCDDEELKDFVKSQLD